MKKLIILLMVALMAVIGLSQQANAVMGSLYDVEIIPQDSQNLNGDTTFFVDVLFNAEAGGNNLGNWQFDLFYDTSELTWNASNTMYGQMPSPLFPGMFGVPVESTLGHIQLFHALKMPANAADANVAGSLLLATVAFDVAPGINMPVPDGLADVWFDTTSPANGFTIDGTSYFMNPTHGSGNIMTIGGTSPDVYVVPEPISSTLFIIGGATLGFRRFRKTITPTDLLK